MDPLSACKEFSILMALFYTYIAYCINALDYNIFLKTYHIYISLDL